MKRVKEFSHERKTTTNKLTTRRFNNIISTGLLPRDFRRLTFSRDLDFIAIHNELAILCFNSSIETTVNRVIFEHVDHVIKRNERIVNSNHLEVFICQRSAKNNTTDTTEAM